MRLRPLAFLLLLTCGAAGPPTPALAQGAGEADPYQPEKVPVQSEPRPPSRWFVGGAAGLSFGTVDFVEIAPLVGYRISRRVSVGAELVFRYRHDGRYVEDVTTTDYGALVFGRIGIAHGFFAEVDVEHLSYEAVFSDLSVERFGETSVFVGGGFSQPAGRHVSFYLALLYNVTWSESDFPSPYSDPLIFRAGITVGF